MIPDGDLDSVHSLGLQGGGFYALMFHCSCDIPFFLEKVGCVVAQAFFSHGASQISLRSRVSRGNQSIYLHRSGPLLENGLDRPKNRHGRYGFPSFYSIFISKVGVDGAGVCL